MNTRKSYNTFQKSLIYTYVKIISEFNFIRISSSFGHKFQFIKDPFLSSWAPRKKHLLQWGSWLAVINP